MRLATFRDAAGTRLGVALNGQIVDLARAAGLTGSGEYNEHRDELRDMLALIAGGADALTRVADLAENPPDETLLAMEDVELLAPIPRPKKNIFCLGRNYAEHAAESLRAIGQ